MDDARTLAAARRRRRWARRRVSSTGLRIHTRRLADAMERQQQASVMAAKIVLSYGRALADYDEDQALDAIIDRMWENA